MNKYFEGAGAPGPFETTSSQPAIRGESLDRYLGQVIKGLRLKNALTIADVAARADLSRGMLSKIENGLASCSLDSLSRIAKALGVNISTLFQEFEIAASSVNLVKRGTAKEVVRRGTKYNHKYRLISPDVGRKKRFEACVVVMDEQSVPHTEYEHRGIEFILMLEGSVDYRVGKEEFHLEPGDALTFDSRVPHGPLNAPTGIARLLSVQSEVDDK